MIKDPLPLMSKHHKLLFQNTDYLILLGSRLFQTLSLQFMGVIVGWQVYQLKHDAFLLGLIGLAEAIPAIVTSFFSGPIIDHSRPARVYQFCTLANTLNSLIMFLAILPQFSLSTDWQVGVLFIGVFISGITRSFLFPSQFALIPRIINRELLASASAFYSSVFTLAQILGPALGGLVFGFFGELYAFISPVILLLVAFCTSLFLSKSTIQIHTKLKHDSVREPIFKSLKEGMNFLFNHKVLLSAMALDMFSVLFGGAVAVLPIFADQVFHIGATGLGILRAAPAVGSVLISVYLGINPMKHIKGKNLLIVIAGFGICMLGFAVSKSFVLALIFLALSGIFDGINMVIRVTLSQLFTPDHMRGRVSSLSTIFITSSNEIGAFESGLAAQYMGLIPSVIFGGIMTLVVVLVIWVKVPDLVDTNIET